MNVNRTGNKRAFTTGFLMASAVAMLLFSPKASAVIFFDIEGNYITIFGYTFCYSDCNYKSGAVELPRRAFAPPPPPK